jgi:hypothetical protein
LSKLSTQALLGIPGVKERLDILKYRNDPQQRAGGNYYVNPVTGSQEYFAKLPDGMTPDGQGGARVMPGFAKGQADIAGATTAAQEGAKDQFAMPTTVNLPGGPRLMLPSQARAMAAGGTQGPAPALPGPAGMPSPAASGYSNLAPQAGVTGRFVGDPADVIEGISKIKDPQEQANALAAFAQQMRAAGGKLPPVPAQGQGAPGIALQTPADAKVAEERGAAAINAAKIQESTKPLLAAIDQALAINQKVPYGPFGIAEGKRNLSNLPIVGDGEAAKYAGQWDQLMGQNIMNGIASSGLGRMDIPIVNAIKAANGIPMENHPAAREQMLRTLRTLVQNHATSAGNIVPALNEPGATTNTTSAPMQSAGGAPAPIAAKTPAPPVPMKGMIRGGYKFLGGDPASPNSWEKQ